MIFRYCLSSSTQIEIAFVLCKNVFPRKLLIFLPEFPAKTLPSEVNWLSVITTLLFKKICEIVNHKLISSISFFQNWLGNGFVNVNRKFIYYNLKNLTFKLFPNPILLFIQLQLKENLYPSFFCFRSIKFSICKPQVLSKCSTTLLFVMYL